MLADNQSLGSMCVFNDWVNITCKTGATSAEQVLRNQVGMLSGPGAFPCFSS